MPQLILQLALLIAVAFVIGSLLGSFARKRKANQASHPALEKPVEAENKPSPQTQATKEVTLANAAEAVVTAHPADDAQAEPKTESKTESKTEPKTEPAKTKSPASTAPVPVEVSEETTANKKSAASKHVPIKEHTVAKDHAAGKKAAVVKEPEPEPEAEIGLPPLLAAARGGKPDDLLKIKGIGPTLQRKLHALGVYHYDQLAAWDAQNAAWIGEKLNFRGRVEREEWVEQAAALIRLGEKKPAEKTAKKVSAKPAAKKNADSKTTAKAASAKGATKKAPVKTTGSKTRTAAKRAT